MPQYKKTSMRFIRDYLSGKKFLLKAAEVRTFNVPPYEELAVGQIFNQVKEDEHVMQHLNHYADIKELPEHSFFYTVLGTLHPEYVSGLIKGAKR